MGSQDMTSNETQTTQPSVLVKILAAISGLASGIYLANIPMLPPELLPDALPLVGNLDELLVAGVFLWSLRTLRIEPAKLLLDRIRARKQLKASMDPEASSEPNV